MGTRSGDIDPAIITFLIKKGYSAQKIDNILNKESGVFGLTSYSDMRDVDTAIKKGSQMAKLALEIYTNKIKSTVGSYCALLGRVDAIVFTAGVGENNSVVRKMSLSNLDTIFGISIDEKINNQTQGIEAKISSDESKIPVYVIPTNEELEIAKETLSVL
jgi:acetate kinase